MTSNFARVGGALLLSFLAVGCSSHEEPRTTPEAKTPTPTASPTMDVYRTPECRALAMKYIEVLEQGAGTCKTDSDCATYGGVDPANVCGGVTDKPTATALRSVRGEMDGAGCMALPYSCPELRPACASGRCQDDNARPPKGESDAPTERIEGTIMSESPLGDGECVQKSYEVQPIGRGSQRVWVHFEDCGTDWAQAGLEALRVGAAYSFEVLRGASENFGDDPMIVSAKPLW